MSIRTTLANPRENPMIQYVQHTGNPITSIYICIRVYMHTCQTGYPLTICTSM